MYDPREGSRRGRGGDERYGARAEGFQESFLIDLFLEKGRAIQPRRLDVLCRGRDPTAQVGGAQASGALTVCRSLSFLVVIV